MCVCVCGDVMLHTSYYDDAMMTSLIIMRQLGCEGEKHKTSVIKKTDKMAKLSGQKWHQNHRVHTTHTTAGGVNETIHRKIASERGV